VKDLSDEIKVLEKFIKDEEDPKSDIIRLKERKHLLNEETKVQYAIEK
jgi:hypothetical protein